MAEWGKLLGGLLQVAVSVARATLMDWDPTARRLWISNNVISRVLARHNQGVGMLGVLVESSIVGDSAIQIDATTRPFGVRSSFVISEGVMVLDKGRFSVTLRVVQSSGALSILVKALPFFFDALFGFGWTGYRFEIQGDLITGTGPIADSSWFWRLLHAHVRRIDGATIPFYASEGGVVAELAELVPQGALLDVGRSVLALGGAGGAVK